MISLAAAKLLKEAGLIWEPAQGDQFAIPDRDMDDMVFVINDMAVIMEYLRGKLAMTFHGTPEWALDYVLAGETVWLPSESQLRERLEEVLAGGGVHEFELRFAHGTYACHYEWQGTQRTTQGWSGADAYALALLDTLLPGAEQPQKD